MQGPPQGPYESRAVFLTRRAAYLTTEIDRLRHERRIVKQELRKIMQKEYKQRARES